VNLHTPAPAASTASSKMAATKAGPLDFLKEHKLNPQNLQGEFTKWISAQPPWVEVASAALFGSMQVSK
jgi:hypothetical protein